MIQIILGQYLENQVVCLILSNKKYSGVKVLSNGQLVQTIDIKKYHVNRFILTNIFAGNSYKIDFLHGKEILDSCQINLKSDPFDDVLIVNCDSCYGYETGTWDLIQGDSTRFVFHLGDQLYNDHLFFQSCLSHISDMTKSEIKAVHKKCYSHYLQHFTRNNKTNILKNNFNLMMPDDHEIVDNSIIEFGNPNNFKIIHKILEKLATKIELGLRQTESDILFVEDKKHSTVYVVNYSNNFTEESFKKHNYMIWMKNYCNIIFLARKCVGSVQNPLLNQIVFSADKYELVDIDFLLNFKLKSKNSKKKIYVLCGDYHMKNTIEYKKNNKELLQIKNVGAINTVIDPVGVNFIPNTKIEGIEIESSTIRQNGFVTINYRGDTIIVRDIINKKNMLFHLANTILSAKEFIFMKH